MRHKEVKGDNRAFVVLNHTTHHHFCSLLSTLICGQNFNPVSQCSCSIVLTHNFLTLAWGFTVMRLAGAFLPFGIHTHLYFVPLCEDGAASTAGSVL